MVHVPYKVSVSPFVGPIRKGNSGFTPYTLTLVYYVPGPHTKISPHKKRLPSVVTVLIR